MTLTETQKETIIKAAIQFALKCQYESIVKWNLYDSCAKACGIEYDVNHDDWELEGEPEFDESLNIQWEKAVQSVLEQK